MRPSVPGVACRNPSEHYGLGGGTSTNEWEVQHFIKFSVTIFDGTWPRREEGETLETFVGLWPHFFFVTQRNLRSCVKLVNWNASTDFGLDWVGYTYDRFYAPKQVENKLIQSVIYHTTEPLPQSQDQPSSKFTLCFLPSNALKNNSPFKLSHRRLDRIAKPIPSPSRGSRNLGLSDVAASPPHSRPSSDKQFGP